MNTQHKQKSLRIYEITFSRCSPNIVLSLLKNGTSRTVHKVT